MYRYQFDVCKSSDLVMVMNPPPPPPPPRKMSHTWRSFCVSVIYRVLTVNIFPMQGGCTRNSPFCPQHRDNYNKVSFVRNMMTSSNGNIFRVTDHLCGNSPVTGEFPAQRPVTRSFDVFFDLRPNKRLSKHSWGWRFETPSRPLWRHCNEYEIYHDTNYYWF